MPIIFFSNYHVAIIPLITVFQHGSVMVGNVGICMYPFRVATFK